MTLYIDHEPLNEIVLPKLSQIFEKHLRIKGSAARSPTKKREALVLEEELPKKEEEEMNMGDRVRL